MIRIKALGRLIQIKGVKIVLLHFVSVVDGGGEHKDIEIITLVRSATSTY